MNQLLFHEERLLDSIINDFADVFNKELPLRLLPTHNVDHNPFTALKHISSSIYRFDLHDSIHVCPIFHVTCLKRTIGSNNISNIKHMEIH